VKMDVIPDKNPLGPVLFNKEPRGYDGY